MGDWTDKLDPDERDQFDRFVEHTRRDTLTKMAESAFVASVVSKGDVDIKFAVELGLAIMLNKPILALVLPGAKVPPGLAKVADMIVEADIDTEAGRLKVTRAIDQMGKKYDG